MANSNVALIAHKYLRIFDCRPAGAIIYPFDSGLIMGLGGARFHDHWKYLSSMALASMERSSSSEGVKESLLAVTAAVPLDVRKACGFPTSGTA